MVELTEEQKKKFKIIKILDEWRWQDFPTDFEYNFGHYCDTLKKEIRIEFYGGKDDGEFSVKEENKELAEKILLTHYLIYICNRQMNANRVFREGLPVISQIVEDYYEYKDNNFDDFIENHIKTDESGKHRLCANNNTFASRNTAQDYYCIFRTLKTLNEVKKDFSEYLKKNNINDLAESLYQLTYKGVTKIKSSNKKFISVYKEYEQTATRRENYKMDRHKQKRLWCVIRDYLYHPVFKELFKIVIGEYYKDIFFGKEGGKEGGKEIVNNADQLELPGDVWNNNDTFATHFWGETYGNSSKFVRDRFKKNGENNGGTNCWDGCYPHQFDITFNLVPRMCESNNCSMCPICKNGGMDNWDILCHKQNGKYCSFALYATDIKHECEGEKCELLDVILKTKDNTNG